MLINSLVLKKKYNNTITEIAVKENGLLELKKQNNRKLELIDYIISYDEKLHKVKLKSRKVNLSLSKKKWFDFDSFIDLIPKDKIVKKDLSSAWGIWDIFEAITFFD